MGTGIPGLRGGDHVGITVPDIEQAHAFFVDVLGFDYVYSLPEMRHDDDWMLAHLNVEPHAVVREIRFYRCRFGLNFEVFEYEPLPGRRRNRATVTWAAIMSPSTSMTWMPPSPTCARRVCGCSPARSRAATPRPGSAGSTSSARGACSSSW